MYERTRRTLLLRADRTALEILWVGSWVGVWIESL